jgi:glutamate formiminotransferase / 5-formyltetrahydrofolate cyclo-ligase
MAVIECVPNVSEGRAADAVAEMTHALARVAGVRLLDVSSDPSHNRSVFTLAGEHAGLLGAVDALFATALPLIDLRAHRGEHPRMGAVDVVPFVPIAGVSMADCVSLAREAGALIARRFDVPVFLYEEAATTPERRRLEEVRRGGFEGLGVKMAGALWKPDYGPAKPHPTAGATAVGARRVLIAYNINLASADVDVARRIARRIRESSGGLPCVKALGLTLTHRGLVQISMNLTNYEITPVERVFDAVASCARDMGVAIVDSELVGLIPAAALANTSPQHLRLAAFQQSQVLENRLRAAGLDVDL